MEEGGPEAEMEAGYPLTFREDRLFVWGRLLMLVVGGADGRQHRGDRRRGPDPP